MLERVNLLEIYSKVKNFILIEKWRFLCCEVGNTTRGGTMGMPLEINSSVKKRAQNREKTTSGDYYIT